MSMAGFIFRFMFKHSMCIWGEQTVPRQTVLLTAGRSHPLLSSALTLLFPAPEQVHLAPYITSRQGHLVPFPMLSLGKPNPLPSGSRLPASPLLWARLGHPEQLHASKRNSYRVLCVFCKSPKILCDPLKTAVRCLQSLAHSGAASPMLRHRQSLQRRRWLGAERED